MARTPGISKAEVAQFLRAYNLDQCPTVAEVCGWLDRQGMLSDNQPQNAVDLALKPLRITAKENRCLLGDSR